MAYRQTKRSREQIARMVAGKAAARMEQAAVMIGNHPVGPTCARKAGLMPLAQRKSGLVFPVLQ